MFNDFVQNSLSETIVIHFAEVVLSFFFFFALASGSAGSLNRVLKQSFCRINYGRQLL